MEKVNIEIGKDSLNTFLKNLAGNNLRGTRSIPEELKTKEFWKAYANHYKRSSSSMWEIKNMSDELKKDKEFIIQLVKISPLVINYIDAIDREIAIAALAIDNSLMHLIPKHVLKENSEIFIMLNPEYMAKYYDNIFEDDKNIKKNIMNILKYDPGCINILPETVALSEIVNAPGFLAENLEVFKRMDDVTKNLILYTDTYLEILEKDGLLIKYMRSASEKEKEVALKQNKLAYLFWKDREEKKW